jgi:hypothetical protein
VPTEYYDYLDVFSKVELDILPIVKPGVDYRVKLNEGYLPKDLRYNLLYKMSLEESEVYKKYIIKNLRKGFIKSSNTL